MQGNARELEEEGEKEGNYDDEEEWEKEGEEEEG